MKRILSLLLAATLIFSLSACGQKPDPSPVESEPEMEFAEFEWPDTEIAKLMPVPKSNIGNIYWSESYGFVIYVANTSLSDYAAYVEECEAAGFTLDGRKGDDFFWADNEDGYQATVRYQEGDVMFVRIDDPEDDPAEPDETGEPEVDVSTEPTEQPSEEPQETEEPGDIDISDEPEPSETSSSVVYSTNTYEQAKKGNSGVFSYKREGSTYDFYWVIDFDEGCAYWFTYGNANDVCERVQIESGNLNEYIVLTYHDGDSTWQYGLSFKRKNQPDRLIEQHTDGETFEFIATNLDDALELRDSLTIVDY